jgi:hypothetical protein
MLTLLQPDTPSTRGSSPATSPRLIICYNGREAYPKSLLVDLAHRSPRKAFYDLEAIKACETR